MEDKISNKSLIKALKNHVGDVLYSEQEFECSIMGLFLMEDQKEIWKKYVREGAAIAAYQAGQLGAISKLLICDDAPQFKDLTEHLGLCWVHEARHYKKLEPQYEHFQNVADNFMDRFWKYYEKLQRYKEHPTVKKKLRLWKEFDRLFSDTEYYALNNIIKKTRNKKAELLLVLDFPQIPLHNNTSEQDIREKVVQRKIRNCFRSMRGAIGSDTFLSLAAICRKQNLSFWEYVKDRVFQLGQIPPLDEIIKQGGSVPAYALRD